MVLKAVGLLLSILNLSFVSFTPLIYFFLLGRVPCYSLQCTITLFWNTGTCPNFRVKHGTKFWFAGSAFSAPSQYRNWRILISLFETKIHPEEWEHKESSESFKLYCFFFCPSRTTAKSSHQIALRLLLSSSPPPSSSPPLPPESGLIASVQRAITIGWYQCLWVSVRMRVRVWVCVSNLPSNRPCPTVLNKRDFPDDGTVSFIFNSIVVLLSGYY
jgi:hypothetical protein